MIAALPPLLDAAPLACAVPSLMLIADLNPPYPQSSGSLALKPAMECR